jgi:osmotically-inducible protein OsmY
LSAASDLDSTEITVTVLGPYVILEGFVRAREDLERATDIAEEVVGRGHVQARMLRR